MGTRPKKAAGEDEATPNPYLITFDLRNMGPLSKALAFLLAGLLTAGGGGIWANRGDAAKAAEQSAKATAEMAAMTDALTALQGEVATLRGTFVTRVESDSQHALIARDVAAADALLARDLEALNDRLRDVRRDRGSRTR